MEGWTQDSFRLARDSSSMKEKAEALYSPAQHCPQEGFLAETLGLSTAAGRRGEGWAGGSSWEWGLLQSQPISLHECLHQKHDPCWALGHWMEPLMISPWEELHSFRGHRWGDGSCHAGSTCQADCMHLSHWSWQCLLEEGAGVSPSSQVRRLRAMQTGVSDGVMLWTQLCATPNPAWS